MFPGEDTRVVVYVRFGNKAAALSLELLDGTAVLAEGTFNSPQSPPEDRFPDAIVPINGSSFPWEESFRVAKRPCRARKAKPPNVVARVDSLARLPTRWEGYEGVDVVIISTSKPEVFKDLCRGMPASRPWSNGSAWAAGWCCVPDAGRGGPAPARRWRHSSPDASTRAYSCSRPRLGNLRQVARSDRKPGEKVELPTPKLVDVQGKIEAHEADLPLVIRKPQGLGQVIFVAADLDRGPIREWSDRSCCWRGPRSARQQPAGAAQGGRTTVTTAWPDSCRRPGRAPRRIPRAVLRGGPAGDSLHPLDRAGRLFSAPPAGLRHAVDVDHFSRDRRPLCRRVVHLPLIG